MSARLVAERMTRQTRAVLLELMFYLVVLLFAVVLAVQNSYSSSSMAIMAFVGFVTVYWLLQPLEYWPSTLRSVRLAGVNCPQDVETRLKERTLDGDPINRIIVEIVAGEVSPSQTEIYEQVTKEGVELSRTRVNEYVNTLVGCGVLRADPSIKHQGVEKSYELTDTGKWFLGALRTLFPKTRAGFLWRYALSRQEVPRFPSGSAPQPSEKAD
jgi:predicted transcriptional regulator